MPVGSSDTARPTDHKPHKYFGYDMYVDLSSHPVRSIDVIIRGCAATQSTQDLQRIAPKGF